MIVEVSARKFAIPFECPCCGAVPDTEVMVPLARSERRIARESARQLAFPYCKHCVGHVTVFESAGVASAAVMVLAIVAAIVVGIATQIVFGLVVVAAAVPFAWLLASSRRTRARALCGPSCASPGKALAYLGWSGRDTGFSFESHTYAARFAEHNAKISSNVSKSLERLLEGHRIARLAVPTPAAPHLVVPPPATVRDWIARLEGSRGAVERRSTLSRALDGLHEPAERQDVIRAATRLEIAPVLDKLSRLASATAKKQFLQDAIEHLRADNIPDELQESALHELDVRWRELG